MLFFRQIPFWDIERETLIFSLFYSYLRAKFWEVLNNWCDALSLNTACTKTRLCYVHINYVVSWFVWRLTTVFTLSSQPPMLCGFGLRRLQIPVRSRTIRYFVWHYWWIVSITCHLQTSGCSLKYWKQSRRTKYIFHIHINLVLYVLDVNKDLFYYFPPTHILNNSIFMTCMLADSNGY